MQKELCISYTGPTLPKALECHELVSVGPDIMVLGGFHAEKDTAQSDTLYVMSCRSNNCKWDTLPQKLINARQNFVAISVPKDFLKCQAVKNMYKGFPTYLTILIIKHFFE